MKSERCDKDTRGVKINGRGGGGGKSKLSTDRGIQKTTVYRKMIKRILNFMF